MVSLTSAPIYATDVPLKVPTEMRGGSTEDAMKMTFNEMNMTDDSIDMTDRAMNTTDDAINPADD